jgi:hypothetical protein
MSRGLQPNSNALGKLSKASQHPPLASLCAYYHLLAFHFCQGNGGKSLSLNQKITPQKSIKKSIGKSIGSDNFGYQKINKKIKTCDSQKY